MSENRQWMVGLSGAALLLSFGALTSLGDLKNHIAFFLIAYGIAFAFYLIALYFGRSFEKPQRGALIYIFLIAIFARLLGLASAPSLSDDIYRYLWDGRVASAGINPYQYAPEDPHLSLLRDRNYAGINHKNLKTIYPPLAEWVFRIAARISPNILSMKIAFVIFDIATMIVILLLLLELKMNPIYAITYAWNPLVILEFSYSGHLDSLAIFWMALALLFVTRAKSVPGFLSLALSFLAKYFSAITLPYFVLRRSFLKWVALYAGMIVLGYLPFVAAGKNLFESLGVYAASWEFNSGAFTLLRSLISDARILRVGLFCSLILFAFYQARKQEDFLKYSFYVTGFALLLTPTLHPWYLCWIVPFLCFFPSLPWILFTGTIALAYWVWRDYAWSGQWILRPEILWIEYAPFLVWILSLASNYVKRKLPSPRFSGSEA